MCNSEIRYIATEGFIHRQVGGNDILISVGENVANFNGCITLNPAASFLWDALAQPQSITSLVNLLTEEFDVTQDKANSDVKNFLEMLLHHSMVKIYE